MNKTHNYNTNKKELYLTKSKINDLKKKNNIIDKDISKDISHINDA